LPAQLGVQVQLFPMQMPWAPQMHPAAQVPQLIPQPVGSGPHSRPPQLGLQHWQVEYSGAMQVQVDGQPEGQTPPQPSGPPHLPTQLGEQVTHSPPSQT
jgi:hypothetical protein